SCRRVGTSPSIDSAVSFWSTPGGREMDPVVLQIANHRLAGIAEEMGVVLGRTAMSPNIKERRDYSCAVFDAAGGLVAQAAHIPVHLGSTPLSVRAALAHAAMDPGDVVILNDPFAARTPRTA